MNNISKAFENGKAFIGFITAGDPNLSVSKNAMIEMAKNGCDLIEVGIPFSDPIAEGPVIEEASLRSLAGGTTTDKVFDLLFEVSQIIDTPLVIMTYLNVLFRYDYDRFLKRANECGVSGVIIPDLPFEEKHELSDVADKYSIDVISFIAPTSQQRIEMIAKQAKGFLYEVSSLGVTGTRETIKTNIEELTKKAKAVSSVPVAVGFGISTPEQAREMCSVADGIIVGSAIVKIIEKYKEDAPAKVGAFVKEMKDAIR